MPPLLVTVCTHPHLPETTENVPLAHNVSESWSPMAGLKLGGVPVLPRHTDSRFRANSNLITFSHPQVGNAEHTSQF